MAIRPIPPEQHERFPALYIREFRVFWTGQLISFSGTWMQSTAQGWLVYTLTGSPVYLGLVAAAASLPILLFTLVGGVVADRLKKRTLLIITQTASIIPPLLLGLLTDLNLVTVWQIIALAFSLGTLNAFDIPARQSFLIDMVQRGRLLNAIALNSAAFNGARIIGPFIAGLAIATIGIASCFYLNAASFLAAISALLLIKTGRSRGDDEAVMSPQPEQRTSLKRLFQELREGLSFVIRERSIFRILLLVAFFSLFGIPFITLLPVFAGELLKVGPQGLGSLAGSSGLGAFAAALIIAFKSDVGEKGRLMAAAGVVFCGSLMLFSLSRNYAVSLTLLTLTGWGMVSFLAVGNSVIQLSTPDNLRGRVMSVYAFVFLGMAPIGNSIMGVLAHAIGTDLAVFLGSSLCMLAVLVSAHKLRAMDRMQH